MDTKILIYAIIGIFSSIIGVYVFLMKHTSNPKKHPCKNDIVFRDTCQANRDCIEAKLDGMENLMKQGFKNLEKLIRDGDYREPRVRT